MKKILAILLALTLVLSMTPVFAEETDATVGSDGETTEEVTYATLAEKYAAEIGNHTRIAESWSVTNGVVTVDENNYKQGRPNTNFASTYFKGYPNFVIYKIVLPQLANGQKYKKLMLHFGTGTAATYRVIKMPGTDWDFSKNIKEYPYIADMVNTESKYLAAAANTDIMSEDSSATNLRHYYADITEYAQESWYAGQDYIYVGVAPWNSTRDVALASMSDTTYTGAGLQPSIYYSVEDVEGISAVPNTLEAYKAMPNSTNVKIGYCGSDGIMNNASGNLYSSYFTKGQFVVYKIPMPVVPAGKTLGNFVLATGAGTESIRILKMAGEEWTLPGDLSAWYTANKATLAKFEALYAHKGNIIFETTPYYINSYFDVSEYVRECYAAGQEYIYFAAAPYNTRTNVALSTMDDGDFCRVGNNPHYYYTFSDIPELSYVSSTLADGEITDAKEATFTFSNKLASATATINGVETPCTVKGARAKVSFSDAGLYTVQITAKDTARNTVTTDEFKFRVGYNSVFLDNDKGGSYSFNTYAVSSSGATKSTYNVSLNSATSAVINIKLPTIDNGKSIKQFGIRFITPGNYSGGLTLFKIPHNLTTAPSNLIQTSGETPDGKINIYEYFTGASNKYKANIGSVVIEGKNATGDNYHYADITTYAKECIERGQTHMLLGFKSNDTRVIAGIGDSGTNDAKNRYHYIYWTTEDTDFSAKAPKFVASSNENTFAVATGLESLVKGNEYKFITSLTNFGDADASITLYIAQYDADCALINVAAKTVTVGGVSDDYTSANLTIDAEAATVRAFIWDNVNQKPMLIGDSVIELN